MKTLAILLLFTIIANITCKHLKYALGDFFEIELVEEIPYDTENELEEELNFPEENSLYECLILSEVNLKPSTGLVRFDWLASEVSTPPPER